MSSSAVARKFDKSARPYGLRYAARRACGKDLPSSQPKWPSGTPHPCSTSAYYRLCKFRAQHDGSALRPLRHNGGSNDFAGRDAAVAITSGAYGEE